MTSPPFFLRLPFRLLVGVAVTGVALHAALASDRESAPAEPPPILRNGGFESGLVKPWGTLLYPEFYPQAKGVWLNFGKCRSRAEADSQVAFSGKVSLHVVNPGPKRPEDYGMIQQIIKVVPNRRYRVLVWARAKDLASDGAVYVRYEAGRACSMPFLKLDKGTYDWTPFTGTFVCSEAEAALCIISVDAGEAWIDEILIEPEPEAGPAARPTPGGRP